MIEQVEKKELLYVDSPYVDSSGEVCHHELERIRIIKSGLESCFDVTFIEYLTPRVMDALWGVSKSGERFDALLTHFPRDKEKVAKKANDGSEGFYRSIYGNSLQIIKKVRESHYDLPIVVYTDAGTGDEADPLTAIVYRFLVMSGADDFLFKSNDGFADARKIKSSLERAMQIRNAQEGQIKAFLI